MIQFIRASTFRKSVLFCFLLASIASAGTLSERIDAFWKKFVVQTEPADFSERSEAKRLILELQGEDFSSDPALKAAVLQKVYQRLLYLLTALNSSDSVGAGPLVALFEAFDLVAPQCDAGLVEPLVKTVTSSKASNAREGALSTLVRLSRTNDIFFKAINNAQRKAVIAQAEKWRVKYANDVRRGLSTEYSKRKLAEIEGALLFFGVDLAAKREEAAFLLVLTSSDWKAVTTALEGLGRLGALGDEALRALQAFVKREALPDPIAALGFQLIRNNVHLRFTDITEENPTDGPLNQRALVRCLDFFLEGAESEEMPR